MADTDNTLYQNNSYNNFNDYEEEENEDDYDIDNSDLEYLNRSLYIRLNNKGNYYEERLYKLDYSRNTLFKNYPSLKKIESDDILQTILEEVFAEGFNMQMYIRNLSFTSNNGKDIKNLGLRPEKYEDAGFLYDYLPKGVSLLFKGHMNGYEFVIDSIHETADSERLDYEVVAEARPFHTNIPTGNKQSFLYEVLEEAESLTEYTEQKLKEWENYLSWRKELARRQVHGCKYYKMTFDEDKRRVIFWLVCESIEEFQAFKKYLYRDIQVFNNDYSDDKWKFSLRKETGKRHSFDKSIELGRCRGVVEEYYLEGSPEEKEKDTDAKLDQSEVAIGYDEYEEDENESIDLTDHFEYPYIVKVAFELSRSDLDEILDKNVDEDKIDYYINENIIGNYYPQGFLALSAAGDFVLISRFENAISQLKRDESFSPNLALWLFNVERARMPQGDYEENITKWLNKNIESNEDQKTAVYKMLNAPDLCLIQGPPGTGKTTVIAEAIYQFVKTGNRVLVASQSNDAVDNALERLAETPEIRAIRFGQKGKRRRTNEDLSQRKFSEDEALKYFYNSLSNQISETWLDRWTNLEKLSDEYAQEIRDAKLFQRDVEELSVLLKKAIMQCYEKKKERKISFEKLNKANEYNENYMNEQIQFGNFCDFFEQVSEAVFYLSGEQLKIVERNVNIVISELMGKGVYLSSSSLDLDLLGTKTENEYLVYAIKAYWTFRGIVTKMRERNSTKSTDSGLLIITRKIAEIDDKMRDEEDDDIILQLVKERRNFKKQLDDLKISDTSISFSSVENSILSAELKNRIINSSSIIDEAEKLALLLDKFKNAIKNTIIEIEAFLQRKGEIDTAELNEQVEIATAQYEELKARKDEYEKNLGIKRFTLTNLSKKYNLNTNEAEIIVKHIEELREANIKKLKQERFIRDDWEVTLKTFKGHLDDRESFKYDKEYYQKIYVNACNVVGISCTDNMKNLTNNGYNDFDVVIIDEVSKATPPELLIPLMKGRKAILVGDHRQLPPMFNEHEKSYNELIKNQEDIPEEIRDLMTPDSFSRFKNMVTASLFKDYFENADKSIKHSLFTQYRMHSDIMDIINRFYEQHLNKGLSDNDENRIKNHGLTIKGIDGGTFIRPDKHAYWIDSSLLPSGKKFFETRPEGSTSAENIVEQHIIIELLKKMATFYKEAGLSKDNPKTIGIISFYQLQVNSLREMLKNEKKKFDFSAISVDINTVDRFQGKEKQIIITSLVRNPVKAYRSEGSHIAAFERINVAFSRAQELLVIVGSKEMYEKQPVKLPNMDTVGDRTVFVYQNIIDDLQRKSCFMYCSKIINAQLEKNIWSEYEKEYGGKK